MNIFNTLTDGKLGPPPPNEFTNNYSSEFKGLYSINSKNWYMARPYGFKIHIRNKTSPITMFLPISPSNLTIATDFATNMVPTLYGTVEEHSEVRYYDISIEGTTGISPLYPFPSYKNPRDASQKEFKTGRSSFPISQGVSLGGFFSKTLALVNSLKNRASDISTGSKEPLSGVHGGTSGYQAFHNLYRVLLKHKKDASGTNTSGSYKKNHPITFFNAKDNNQYDVVVRSFVMRRSADNPMLYYYSIQLRGYNLRTMGIKDNYGADDWAKYGLSRMGLGGVESSSMLGDIKKIANKAKGIVASFAGGINILGR